mgnify:FL=1
MLDEFDFYWVFRFRFRLKTMSLTKAVYSIFFRRSASIALLTVVGVFGYERVINKSAEYIYERHNQGKLWKHVQPQFKLKTDDDEE